MSLATREHAANGTMLATGRSGNAPATHSGPASAIIHTLDEVWQMAEAVSQSKLFSGIQNAHQAFTLMLICQSEGMHPMQALRIYHIIEGKPAMRADAIQAKFLERGGRIEILRSDEIEARAIFSHPVFQPKPIEAFVTFAQFEKGYATGKFGIKDNWKNSRPDMLWARLVTKWVRKIDPNVIVGLSSSAEVIDQIQDEAETDPLRPRFTASVTPAPPLSPPVECDVLGFTGSGPDSRPYHKIVAEAVEEFTRQVLARAEGNPDLLAPLTVKDVHHHILNRAIQLAHIDGPKPEKPKEALAALNGLYKSHRDFVRAEIMNLVVERFRVQEEAIQGLAEKHEAEEALAEAEYAGAGDGDAGREPGQEG